MRKVGGQSGFTLIEAVVSLALVTTVVLGLAAGLLTTVRSSTSAKDTQAVDAALSAYAESFKRQTISQGCPTRAQAATPGVPPEDPAPQWMKDDPDISYGVDATAGWDEAAAEAGAADPWEPCSDPGDVPLPGAPDTDLHRIEVWVETPTSDGVQRATGQVVVRQST